MTPSPEMDSKARIKKRVLRIVFVSILVLATAARVIHISARNTALAPSTKNLPVAGTSLGGAFTLTDQDGKTVTEKTFAGRAKLIYFGFTSCAEVCPVELQKISRVVQMFEKDHPEDSGTLQPLFVTVDPQRDTVSVLHDYVPLFHPRLIGLTGTQAQIEAVQKAYHVYATKAVPEKKAPEEHGHDGHKGHEGPHAHGGPQEPAAQVDHSSFIYLMGPQGDLLALYKTQDTAEEIYKDLKDRL